MFDKLRAADFDVLTLHHAEAILTHDMPQAALDIESVLLSQHLPVIEIIKGGGGEGLLTQRLRKGFARNGLVKHNFEIKTVIDGVEKEAKSHEVDHVKCYNGCTMALEIEWNNKDPFFDRDLENFQRLHAQGAISVGGIITRGRSLQDNLAAIVERFANENAVNSISSLAQYYAPTKRQESMIAKQAEVKGSFAAGWASAFTKDKFGEATTHWRKLEDRVRRGVGNPCPFVLIGIPDTYIR